MFHKLCWCKSDVLFGSGISISELNTELRGNFVLGPLKHKITWGWVAFFVIIFSACKNRNLNFRRNVDFYNMHGKLFNFDP